MLTPRTKKALLRVADFYDQRKVGHVGNLGFRRSSDLTKLLTCLETMIEQGHLIPGQSTFLDLGCADGRVNVLLSYLVNVSAGIELDEWTLDEYGQIRSQLDLRLKKDSHPLPSDNIYLFHGDSMDETLHEKIKAQTGVGFEAFDLFYTYLTMHEEFAGMIAQRAKPGSVFMVYGLERIMPRFEGLKLLTPKNPLEGILALYQKI